MACSGKVYLRFAPKSERTNRIVQDTAVTKMQAIAPHLVTRRQYRAAKTIGNSPVNPVNDQTPKENTE